MTTFPSNLIPSARTYSPGAFPHTAHGVYDGSEARVRHSNTVLGVRLRLFFPAITSAELLTVISHYSGQRGRFLPFVIPNDLLSGVTTPADFTPAGHQWRYAARPTVEDISIVGGTNRHDLTIELETVPPENTIAQGVRLRARASLQAGSAQLGAFFDVYAWLDAGAGSVVDPFLVTATLAAGAASAAAPWSPADISTALWLDASDSSTITTAGAAVSAWNDKSGNARHFEQATSGLRPTHTTAALNGLAVVNFAADYLTSTAATSTWTFLHNSTGSSVFAVAKAGTTSNPGATYGIAGTNQGASAQIGYSLYYSDDGINDYVGSLVGNGSASNATIINESENVWTANAYQVAAVVSDPGNATAASRSFIYMNGNTAIANNVRTTTRSTSTASHNLSIGAIGSSFPLTGGVAEFVIVSGVASTDTRQRMEGYLAHKWGLTAGLPGGHPYKSTPP